jgi:hypothetical protein
MKKITVSKKLTLNKEAITLLSNFHLSRVNGGDDVNKCTKDKRTSCPTDKPSQTGTD